MGDAFLIDPLEPDAVRAQFPVLAQRIYGAELAYLDNAATTQMAMPVQEAMRLRAA